MKRNSLISLIIISIFFLSTHQYDYRVEGNTYLLSELTMDIAKGELEHLVVYFHDPTCLPCRQFLEAYYQTSREIQNTFSDRKQISLGYIDITKEEMVPHRLKITHFPYIQFFKDGKLLDEYYGEYETTELFNWIIDHIYLPRRFFEQADDHEIFGDDDFAVVLYGEYSTDIGNKIIHAARPYQGVVFAFHTEDEKFAKAKGLPASNEPTVIILSRFNKPLNLLVVKPGEIESKLKLIIGDKRIHYLNEVVANQIQNDDIIYCFLFFIKGKNYSKEKEAFYNMFRQLSLNPIKFIKSDLKTPLGKSMASKFGIKDSMSVAIYDARENKAKYVFQGSIDTDSLVKFYEDSILSNKNAFYLSQKVDASEISNSGPNVKAIGSSNIFDIIKNAKKDVFILFCHFYLNACKDAIPHYKSIAYKFKESADFYEIDLTKNDLNLDEFKSNIIRPEIPNLVLYRNSGKIKFIYNSNFNVIHIKKWLNENNLNYYEL